MSDLGHHAGRRLALGWAVRGLIETGRAGYAAGRPRISKQPLRILARIFGKDRHGRHAACAEFEMIKRLYRLAATIGVAIVTMVLAHGAALADKRVALVVGNSAYQSVPKLPNPS